MIPFRSSGVRLVRRAVRSRVSRVWAIVLTVGQVLLSVPALAQSPTTPATKLTAKPLPAPIVRVNRTAPIVAPPALEPVFSVLPTTEDISRARIFREPLVPVGGEPTPAENAALARALLSFHRSGATNWRPTLAAFLAEHPDSPWRASLLANLGVWHAQRHAYTRALDALDRAWALSRDATHGPGRTVADLALSEWASTAAEHADVEVVAQRLTDVQARVPNGTAGVKLAQARETVASVRREQGRTIPCGIEALAALLAAGGVTPPAPLLAQRAPQPMTLVDVQAAAAGAGLALQIVARTMATAYPVPAVVHLRIGHYATIVEQRGEAYRIVDRPGEPGYWLDLEALLDESSGYVLTASQLPDGWRAVDRAEAAQVRGASLCPAGNPPPAPPCPDGMCCLPGRRPGRPGCQSCAGMPEYSFQGVTASLTMADSPAGYQPPRGPSVWFTFNYHQRNALQPATFTSANVGPKWEFDWLRYVQEEPADPQSPPAVAVYQPPGGREVYYYPDANGVYEMVWSSRAQFVRVSSNPIRYERRLPDGTVEVYGLSDGAPAGTRRVFLTDVVDPLGQSVHLTWDSARRLVAITDAIGQVSTLEYAHPTDPLKITSVTDPFGRSAVLTYNVTGQLASITDVLVLRSSFAYGPNDFVHTLTTPYGPTTFRTEPYFAADYRMIEATDPLGGTEHLEQHVPAVAIPDAEPASAVPAGFAADNRLLDQFNTFFWDKRAWALGTGDLTKATITHWLMYADRPAAPVRLAPLAHSVKRPLERRVWYRYPGQVPGSAGVGDWREPSQVARVLEDGTSQVTASTYTDRGSVLTRTDPLGRQTTYTYAADNTTLTSVRQTTGGINDLLGTYGSFTTHQQPQTVTDAAGQSTTMTYNAAGQVLTVTNAKSETTTSVYDAEGRLQSVTGPVSGATTTYTYDGYGRVRTITDADAYTVTTDYDVFDRPIRTTYPDGTYEETTYDRLDVSTRRDRAGRITRYYYDALRRLTATRDPAGRVITREWCACGSLNALIDANGNRTSWDRDIQGRVTRELRADGVTATTYTYGTASGRLLTVTDPKQQVTTYTYNLDDSIASTAWTNAQIATPTVSYTYDPAYGRVATMLDGIGTTVYTYPPAGQLGAGQVASVDGPLTDDTITYTYDELGRVTTRAINGAANTVTWIFDPLGRVSTEQNLLGTFTYTYDGITGRVATVTYPNAQTSVYSYFDNQHDRRLERIHHKYPNENTLSRFDYTYDAMGKILTWRQQADNDAVLWEYGYDLADQLTSALKNSVDPTPVVLKRYAYAFDPAGNRTVEQIDDQVTGATYDNLNRLVRQQPAGAIVVAGTVSEPAAVTVQGKPVVVTSANTFTTTVPVVAGTNTVSVAATDLSGNAVTQQYEVDSVGAGQTLTYDANGNLTADRTRTFEWDARNQLVAVNAGTHRSEFTYNGQQRRVRIVEKENATTQSDFGVVWCDEQVCEERVTGGTIVARRWFTQGELLGSVARLFTTDHLGSVREVSNSTAFLLDRSGYDPWGTPETLPADQAHLRFTGHQWESPAGGWLTKYRFLDVASGRWSSPDPLGFADGPNLYIYARNNPIKYIDPTGETAGAAAVGWFVGQVVQCAGTMGDYVNTFHRPNEQNNRYAHCLASCLIKNVCPGGGTTASAAGFAKEIIDVARCAAGRQASCDSMMEKQDFIDNQRGRDCPKNTSCLVWCSDLKNKPDKR